MYDFQQLKGINDGISQSPECQQLRSLPHVQEVALEQYGQCIFIIIDSMEKAVRDSLMKVVPQSILIQTDNRQCSLPTTIIGRGSMPIPGARGGPQVFEENGIDLID
jgi:hypothetical protein